MKHAAVVERVEDRSSNLEKYEKNTELLILFNFRLHSAVIGAAQLFRNSDLRPASRNEKDLRPASRNEKMTIFLKEIEPRRAVTSRTPHLAPRRGMSRREVTTRWHEVY